MKWKSHTVLDPGAQRLQSILSEFPEKMSKEQFYKLCHISKNHARALLTSGTVPCRVNQRATHKYEIATLDVIAYLESLPRVRRKRGGVPQSPNSPGQRWS